MKFIVTMDGKPLRFYADTKKQCWRGTTDYEQNATHFPSQKAAEQFIAGWQGEYEIVPWLGEGFNE